MKTVFIRTGDLHQLRESFADEFPLVCMEECAELAKAISKRTRCEPGLFLQDDLIEEIADVIICIEMLMANYEISEIELDAEIIRKMKRNMERLEK